MEEFIHLNFFQLDFENLILGIDLYGWSLFLFSLFWRLLHHLAWQIAHVGVSQRTIRLLGLLNLHYLNLRLWHIGRVVDCEVENWPLFGLEISEVVFVRRTCSMSLFFCLMLGFESSKHV